MRKIDWANVNWSKVEALSTIILAVFAIFATILGGYAYINSQDSLNLQNTVANYKVKIVPYIVLADLDQFYYNGSTELSSYGYMNLSMVVITPHALIINCSDFLNQTIFHYKMNSSLYSGGTPIPLYDSNKMQYNEFYMGLNMENPKLWVNQSIFPSILPPGNQRFVAFVQPGITLVNFSIPMYANLWLNQELFNNMLQAGGSTGIYAQLADFNINATVTDMQTNKPFIQGFSGTVDTYLWVDTSPPNIP